MNENQNDTLINPPISVDLIIGEWSQGKKCQYIMDAVLNFMTNTLYGVIICSVAITVILVIVLRNSLFWGAPVVVSVFWITFELQKIKRLCEYYEQNIKYVYGEDYLEKEVEHAINYAKGKNNTNSDAREVSDTQ